METDGRRMCEVLVGLGKVDLVGVEELVGDRLRVTIRSRGPRPVCGRCGGRVWSKGERLVRLRWRKRRWMCPDQECGMGSFAEQDLSVAPERGLLTSRAGRWATEQVGRLGRTVSEVAEELGCDWHTVNKEVVRWGDALLGVDVSRFGQVEAVGVDETLFWKKGRWKTKQWCTSVVDVSGRQLLDIVPGRTAESAASWFRSQPVEWCDGIRWAVLDMSGPYQVAYDRVLPHAYQVADPFHVVRLANRCVDLVRRRVQNETLGHRGRKGDPLYRIRRLLIMASERLDSGRLVDRDGRQARSDEELAALAIQKTCTDASVRKIPEAGGSLDLAVDFPETSGSTNALVEVTMHTDSRKRALSNAAAKQQFKELRRDWTIRLLDSRFIGSYDAVDVLPVKKTPQMMVTALMQAEKDGLDESVGILEACEQAIGDNWPRELGLPIANGAPLTSLGEGVPTLAGFAGNW